MIRVKPRKGSRVEHQLGVAGERDRVISELDLISKLVKGRQKTVTDGPFAEAKDTVGGYTLIEARDLD